MALPPLDAGAVYVTLGARVDEYGFKRYDSLIEKAKAARSINRKLGFTYDDTELRKFKNDAQGLRDKTVKVKVEADDAGLRRFDQAAQATDRSVRRLSGSSRELSNSMGGRLRGILGDMVGSFSRLSLSIGFLSGRLENLARASLLLGPILLGVAGILAGLGASAGNAALGVGALGAALGGVLFANLPLGIGLFSRFGKVLEVVKDREKAVEDVAVAGAKAQDKAAAATDARGAAMRSLRDANQAQVRAERNLRDAVDDAREAIERARRAARDRANDEMRAEADLALVRADLTSDGRDVLDAEERLTDARQRARDANKELRELEKDGVRNNPQVVGAREAVRDANERVADSLKQLRRAGKDAAAAMAVPTSVYRSAERESNLTDVEKRLVRSIERIRKTMSTALAPAVDAIMGGVADGLDNLNPLLERFDELWENVGTTIGDALRSATEALNNDEWTSFFEETLGSSPAIIENLLGALGELFEIFRDIAQAALPELRTGLSDLREWLDKVSDSLTVTDARDAIKDMVDSFREWLDLARAVSELLFELFRTGADEGDGLANTLTRIIDGWTQGLKDNPEAFGDFIRKAADFAERLWEFLKPIIGGMATLVDHITELANLIPAGSGILTLIGYFMAARLLTGVNAFAALMRLMRTTFATGSVMAGLKAMVGLAGVTPDLDGDGKGDKGKKGGKKGRRGGRGAGDLAESIPFLGTLLIGGGIAASALGEKDPKKRDAMGLADQLRGAADSLGPEQFAQADQLGKLADQLERAVRAGDGGRIAQLTKDISALGGSIGGLSGKRIKDVASELEQLGGAPAKTPDEVKSAIHRLRNGTTSDLKTIRSNVNLTMGLIEKRMPEGSAEATQAMTDVFNANVDAIKDAMRDHRITVEEGNKEINRVVRAQLKRYGITGEKASRYMEGRDTLRGTTDPTTRGNPGTGAATGWVGGPNLFGADEEIVRVGRGEAILNFHQQRVVDSALRGHGVRGGLNDLFRGRNSVHSVGQYQGGMEPAMGFATGREGAGSLTGDLDMGPALKAALARMARETGISIYVQDGGRTLQEQAQRRAKYGSGAAAVSLKAPHVAGYAADITPGAAVFGKIARRFGIHFPLANWSVRPEPWHAELMSKSGGRSRGGGGGGMKVPTAIRVGRVQGGGAYQPLLQQAVDAAARGGTAFVRQLAGFAGGRPGAYSNPRRAGRHIGRSLSKLFNSAYRADARDLERLDQTFSDRDSAYGKTDEPLIIERPGQEPVINEAGVERRVKELRDLINLRDQMVVKIDALLTKLRKAVEVLPKMIARLAKARNAAKKGGAARSGYNKLLTLYRGNLEDYKDSISSLEGERVIATGDRTSLAEELGGLTGSRDAVNDALKSAQGTSDTPVDMSVRIREAMDAFNQQRVELFQAFGSNYINSGMRATYFNTPETRSEGFQYFGAGSGGMAPGGMVPVGGGAPGGRMIDGGPGGGLAAVRQLNVTIAEPPEDPHLWTRSLDWELRVMG